ncbi:MAG: sulfur carrier protein ThiS [Ruminococcus sp.]|nr:sulfur carrier protein ThiS [Ruminococcus sp.]MCR5142582.1 sulfur carrier protein ThiS [Ruminococcus sp.]
MIKVNGEQYAFDGKTVAELLDELGYKRERVAVELDLDIVPKSEYDTTILAEGCSVEVVSFVGGG